MDGLALLEQGKQAFRPGRRVGAVVHADQIDVVELCKRCRIEVVPGLGSLAVAMTVAVVIGRAPRRLNDDFLIAHRMCSCQKCSEMLTCCFVVANHDRGPPPMSRTSQGAQQKRGSQLPDEDKYSRCAYEIGDKLSADIFKFQRKDRADGDQRPCQQGPGQRTREEIESFSTMGPVRLGES